MITCSLQKIAELELQLERQDVRGTALRAAIAKLQEYAKDANEKAETADRDLLDLDHEFTILKANVSCTSARKPWCQAQNIWRNCMSRWTWTASLPSARTVGGWCAIS